MRKYVYALFAASAIACAARSPDEIGSIEQPVRSEIGFGVKSNGATEDYKCNKTWSGTCWLGAPGENGVVRVYIDETTMTGAEAVYLHTRTNEVIAALNAGQSGWNNFGFTDFDPYNFEQWIGSSGSAHVIIRKGATGCDSGPCLQGVDAYVDPTCTAMNPLLTETPVNYAGSYRICTRWQVTIDVDDINEAVYGSQNKDKVARFAIASGLLASAGTGRLDSGPYWDGDDVAVVIDPDNAISLAAFPVSNSGACRADAYVASGSTFCYETDCSFGLNLCP